LTTKTDRAKIIIKVITYYVSILNIIITNMQLLYIISTFIFIQWDDDDFVQLCGI